MAHSQGAQPADGGGCSACKICCADASSPRYLCVQVVTLDMGLLVAGTKYRGEFEERLKKLMEEIKQNKDIILVRTLPGVWPAALLCRAQCACTGMDQK